jgi:hypothetical protein
VGWILKATPADRERYCKRLLSDPVVSFVDRTNVLWVVLGLAIPFAIAGWAGLVWGGLVRIAVGNHLTFAINSVCHTFGKQPFDTGDESRNNWLMGTIGLGEAGTTTTMRSRAWPTTDESAAARPDRSRDPHPAAARPGLERQDAPPPAVQRRRREEGRRAPSEHDGESDGRGRADTRASRRPVRRLPPRLRSAALGRDGAGPGRGRGGALHAGAEARGRAARDGGVAVEAPALDGGGIPPWRPGRRGRPRGCVPVRGLAPDRPQMGAPRTAASGAAGARAPANGRVRAGRGPARLEAGATRPRGLRRRSITTTTSTRSSTESSWTGGSATRARTSARRRTISTPRRSRSSTTSAGSCAFARASGCSTSAAAGARSSCTPRSTTASRRSE